MEKSENKQELNLQTCIQVCYEAERALSSAHGDNSVPNWGKVEKWRLEEISKRVHDLVKNPENTPEKLHNDWLKIMREKGMKFGPVSSPANKEHPRFVAYSELPLLERKKDELFTAIVKILS